MDYEEFYYLKITVEDTGIGIKEHDISNLFKLFGKLEDEKDMNRGGCGLGLVITKALVKELSGEILVSSELGSGTKFEVFFKNYVN